MSGFQSYEKMIMPIYTYIHPKTKEKFDIIRPISERNEPYIYTDGEKCQREEIPNSVGYCGLAIKEREIWDLEKKYVKKCNPKYVKTRSGKKIPYDPNSMGY